MPHIDYVREAGSEGIELVMWLIARGAMADVAGGPAPHRGAPLLPCARVQHRRGPPDSGESIMPQAITSCISPKAPSTVTLT